MATIEQDVAQIRQAIYGKDVREAIADGIEKIGQSVEYSVKNVDSLENAFTSRKIAFDIFALYGQTTSETYNGVSYLWNGQTCTVSGTANNSNSYNNIIDISLPKNGLSNPFRCYIETSGNYYNVLVQVYLLNGGSIVDSRSMESSSICKFTTTSANRLIVRLYVASGSTASGSITVKVFNDDVKPFGVRIVDTIGNGTNLNNLEDGMYLLPDGISYVNGPPFSPCYLFSYTGYSTGLQLAYPYTPQAVTVTAPYIRSKHIDGTWTEWYIQSDFSQEISNFAVNNVIDVSNVNIPGFYLIYEGKTYQNLPFSGIGFLLVYKSKTAKLQIAIPWSTNAFYMRRNLNDGTWSDWQMAGGGGSVYNITNEYTFPEYSQSVTLNASPSITADTNNYLASSGDNTDRTSDILAMLSANGICHLGPGRFVVTNLQMPDGSSIVGSGYGTCLKLGGTSDGFAVKMGSRCLVKDIRILGSDSEPSFTSTVGGRHGILWQGDYTQSETSPDRGIVSNVWIHNFTGGGITCYDSGFGTTTALEVTNAQIWSCWAGINISYFSEYHKFTNVRSGMCRIGCVNNGGNNVFVNCDFSSNLEIAMLMDNSQSQSPNNTHGSAVGCVFNHTKSGGVSNSGIGVKIINGSNGFAFVGCQFFFSKIDIVDTTGITFSGCVFGYSNCDISISGGGPILFVGNQHQDKAPITVSNNDYVHFVDCYNRTNGSLIELYTDTDVKNMFTVAGDWCQIRYAKKSGNTVYLNVYLTGTVSGEGSSGKKIFDISNSIKPAVADYCFPCIYEQSGAIVPDCSLWIEHGDVTKATLYGGTLTAATRINIIYFLA